MAGCSEKSSKKNNWDYCTASPDKLFGVYIGCCCKKHDISYSMEGKIYRRQADINLRKCIRLKFIAKRKPRLGWLVSRKYFFGVVVAGLFFWKKWSSKGVKKYE